MSEDIIKRRQLLREKLEGRVEEKSEKSIPVVKSSRLNIPSIFQNASQENLSTQPILVQKNISKSTGNLHKESSFKLSVAQENIAPIKPPRKSKEKLIEPEQPVASLNNDNFFYSNEELPEPKSEPVIVELRKKPQLEEETPVRNTQSFGFLRRKKSDLSPSVDSSTTIFNFTDKSPQPKSPVLKNLEHNPSLKRSGSRVGFIGESALNEEKEEYNTGEELYDNLNLKNVPVAEKENENLYENLEVIRANKYYSKKIIMGPISKIPLPNKRCEKPELRPRSII